MMDQRLVDVLEGREDNYLLPFYWQHGDHHDKITEQIERIAQSGCRALCVESRPHPDFGGEGWWRDMDLILSQCEKRGMKVWILDDKHFPTGYANGQIPAKYPHLRQWLLRQRHVDVIGPMEGATLLMTPDSEEEPLLGVYAFRRTEGEEEMTGEPIDLTAGVHGGYLYWDIPEGCYRIFFLYKTRRGGHAHYIDMISPESVKVQIEAVYEPHYARYERYFGNTLAGFFSDEPSFGNGIIGPTRVHRGMYDQRIGMESQALPYNNTLLAMMSQELGEDALPYLGELWYGSPHAHLTRHAYMNAVTKLYRDCFCRQLGDWCRAHGVEYIGHIIEDMNAHGRLGCSAGHYFRALEGQDMSGIDLVLHQVMPGFARYMHTCSASREMADPEFYHYVLAKLGASLAHQSPRMKGRAMCEIFGAYGWGEGAPMMRWLMDFMLVRGINYFVPHAFSPTYPDPDCPPHFGGEGHDPQFEGFSALMKYTNQISHLLTGGRHIASAAILYHAEGEWMSYDSRSGEGSMLTDQPAKALYDAHIDYDIVPADLLLEGAEVKDRALCIGEETFGALIVPYAKHLPCAVIERLTELAGLGLPVLFVQGLPMEAEGGAHRVVELSALAKTLRSEGIYDLAVEGDFPLLRIYHYEREGNHRFFLFNESPDQTADTTVVLPVTGEFARLRLLEDAAWGDHTSDGKVHITLLPGQSEMLVFGGKGDLPSQPSWKTIGELTPAFSLELAESEDLTRYTPYTVTDKLFMVNSPQHLPDFSGKMRYRFTLTDLPADASLLLDLGRVGQTARLFVDGKDCGIRIAPPYRFALPMSNTPTREVVVEVANTLVGKWRDGFSHYLQLPPSGLLGPLTLWAIEKAT